MNTKTDPVGSTVETPHALAYGLDLSDQASVREVVAELEKAFEQPFSVVDVRSGNIVHTAANSLNYDLLSRVSLCDEVARRQRPDILDECAPLVMLAFPIPSGEGRSQFVATSVFVTDPIDSEGQIAAGAEAFGVSSHQAFHWAQQQITWHPRSLLRLSEAITQNISTRSKLGGLKTQLANVSTHLLNTFEEITLLHRLTQHLSLSSSVGELCEMAVGWLSDVVPAECIAIRLTSSVELSDSQQQARIDSGVKPLLVTFGDLPVDKCDIDQLITRLGPSAQHEPIVVNPPVTLGPSWFYSGVRELICLPIREGEHLFGWLLAFNHTGKGSSDLKEFGTMEASLMSSVAVILGIHSGNISLYREQSEFFASVIRALTSAIDAKDPYTCGHSDRVARLSMCLARQLNLKGEELERIYLSGLLHDIGKIGIDDNVLRKPGPLTKEEFEHIKTHPDLGYKILEGIKQLDDVLPVVLHHHEAWDGSGYPHGLKGEETPLLARIVAVADSIDAMSSDRPYRKGIPEEKLYEILRDGAGHQWDATAIEAAFAVREEIRRIGQCDREPLSFDMAMGSQATPSLMTSV